MWDRSQFAAKAIIKAPASQSGIFIASFILKSWTGKDRSCQW